MSHMVIAPGQTCHTCMRRVPYPKTETSPPTKKKAYWVPADAHADHEEVLRAAAEFLGTYERPFYEFETVTLGLVRVMQDESLRGYARPAA